MLRFLLVFVILQKPTKLHEGQFVQLIVDAAVRVLVVHQCVKHEELVQHFGQVVRGAFTLQLTPLSWAS